VLHRCSGGLTGSTCMRRKRPGLFRGRHFEAEAERNLSFDHVTIWRWVQRYAPELERRCRPELRNTDRSWRVDETYCRVAGKWTYLYRAVDSTGATIDFLLSASVTRLQPNTFCKRHCDRRAIHGRG